jgi:hypothetical protein
MSRSTRQGRNGHGNSQGTDYDEQRMQVQELIEMGTAAAQALNSPVFRLAHQGSINDLINRLVASEPHETKKREALYHEIRAHGAVANNLALMAQRAHEILEQQSSEQTRSDALDRQGFGLNENWDPTQGPMPDAV